MADSAGAHGLDQLPHRGSGLLRLGSGGGPVTVIARRSRSDAAPARS